MAECVECKSADGIVQHHVNYHTDETVPVCRSCHRVIHSDRQHNLYPIGEPDEVNLRLSEELADELFDRKRRGESYEDVIWRLIEKADSGGESDTEDKGE